MSIKIKNNICIKCMACSKICPGNLLKSDSAEKVIIKYPDQCWGCAACVKECPVQAISLFIGEDLGGRGGKMTAKQSESGIIWTITKPNNEKVIIETRTEESNKY